MLKFRNPNNLLTSHTLILIILLPMKTGKVKFFNHSKGYGFIKDTETDTDYFVHVSGLIDEIKENDEVTFDLKEGRKGMNAVDVKLVQNN